MHVPRVCTLHCKSRRYHSLTDYLVHSSPSLTFTLDSSEILTLRLSERIDKCIKCTFFSVTYVRGALFVMHTLIWKRIEVLCSSHMTFQRAYKWLACTSARSSQWSRFTQVGVVTQWHRVARVQEVNNTYFLTLSKPRKYKYIQNLHKPIRI